HLLRLQPQAFEARQRRNLRSSRNASDVAVVSLFQRKPLSQLVADSEGGGVTLRRSLGPVNLIALGVGSIIGAGLFVRTAAAAANNAGPSVTISFILAGIGCAFAGLCYAEFASMIPIAGSAYTYSYATMGELPAWIIGWDLVLEYGIGAAMVGIGWGADLNKLLEFFPGGHTVPFQWCHSPFDVSPAGVRGIMNLPAVFIIFLLTLLLIRGMKESAFVNGLIVITKVTIVILIITLGWGFIDQANHEPYIPQSTTVTDSQGVSHHYGGILGILGAAGAVFFALLRFCPGSTAAHR